MRTKNAQYCACERYLRAGDNLYNCTHVNGTLVLRPLTYFSGFYSMYEVDRKILARVASELRLGQAVRAEVL